MTITLAYVTARQEPRLERLFESLRPQLRSDDHLELVLVDFYGRGVEALGVTRSECFANVIASKPKPTIWQGEHRVTQRDFWAMSSARNTAIVLCETSFIAFLDDRCALSPGWLEVVRAAAQARTSVVAGPYDKQETRGLVVDHRTEQLAKRGRPSRQTITGSWLFGGNFCLPLNWALDVNGFEEGCDCVGGEDYIFGQMLENAGRRLEFDPAMHIVQDRNGIDHPFPRDDKGTSPNDKSHAMNARFGPRTRTEFTPDLRALRALRAGGEPWPIPDAALHRDWYDGQPIRERVLPT